MIALLAATCTLAAAGQLPDQHCTPGTVFTTVTQTNIDRTICVPGWSSAHRKVSTRTRARVYASYGLTGDHPFPEWEVDHRVPLELGGSNSVRNLWPQHAPGDKDRLENRLHDRVCDHTMKLRTAQRLFRSDWRGSESP